VEARGEKKQGTGPAEYGPGHRGRLKKNAHKKKKKKKGSIFTPEKEGKKSLVTSRTQKEGKKGGMDFA